MMTRRQFPAPSGALAIHYSHESHFQACDVGLLPNLLHTNQASNKRSVNLRNENTRPARLGLSVQLLLELQFARVTANWLFNIQAEGHGGALSAGVRQQPPLAFGNRRHNIAAP